MRGRVNIATATPHINIPGKSARVKHLFSTRGFSKWRESGCSNSAEAAITRLAGRLSICILSTDEFITVSAFSLSLGSSFSLTFIPAFHPLLLLLVEFSFYAISVDTRGTRYFPSTHYYLYVL